MLFCWVALGVTDIVTKLVDTVFLLGGAMQK